MAFIGLVTGQHCEKDSFLHYSNKHCGLETRNRSSQ